MPVAKVAIESEGSRDSFMILQDDSSAVSVKLLPGLTSGFPPGQCEREFVYRKHRDRRDRLVELIVSDLEKRLAVHFYAIRAEKRNQTFLA